MVEPMTPAPPDVLAELNAVADELSALCPGLVTRKMASRLRAVAEQIAERERVDENVAQQVIDIWIRDFGGAYKEHTGWPNLKTVIAMIVAKRERHVAKAVRERAAEVAGTGFAEDAPDKIRTLDLSPILKPEKSNG